ncbi:hypothetical protein GGR52DRAFT_198561 [Hypoxylon sp. FL1284]|nr:hypothetical protein GGR52DRAFT_198561 [Hypoxylon sp. FL1284]
MKHRRQDISSPYLLPSHIFEVKTVQQRDNYMASSLPLSISQERQASLSAQRNKTPIMLRSSCSVLFHTASSQAQTLPIQPVSEPDSGMRVLFQHPIRPKSNSTSDPSREIPLHTTAGISHSRSASLQSSMSKTPGTAYLRSIFYKRVSSRKSSSLEPQAFQCSRTQHRAVLALSSSDPGAKAVHDPRDTERDLPVMKPRDDRVALAHISTYYARMTEPGHMKKPVQSGPTGDSPPGIKSTAWTVSQLKKATKEQIRPELASPVTSCPGSESARNYLLTARSPDSGPMIATPRSTSGKDVADSQAWQRKTRMLQIY